MKMLSLTSEDDARLLLVVHRISRDVMSNKKLLLTAAAVMATAGTVALNNAGDVEAGKKSKEKCYGVAKAGMNDCGSLDGAHSCAGQAKTDNDPNEWVYLPEGICDKLAGGKVI